MRFDAFNCDELVQCSRSYPNFDQQYIYCIAYHIIIRNYNKGDYVWFSIKLDLFGRVQLLVTSTCCAVLHRGTVHLKLVTLIPKSFNVNELMHCTVIILEEFFEPDKPNKRVLGVTVSQESSEVSVFRLTAP